MILVMTFRVFLMLIGRVCDALLGAANSAAHRGSTWQRRQRAVAAATRSIS